jgi:hypothetical protein
MPKTLEAPKFLVPMSDKCIKYSLICRAWRYYLFTSECWRLQAEWIMQYAYTQRPVLKWTGQWSHKIGQHILNTRRPPIQQVAHLPDKLAGNRLFTSEIFLSVLSIITKTCRLSSKVTSLYRFGGKNKQFCFTVYYSVEYDIVLAPHSVEVVAQYSCAANIRPSALQL